MSVVRALWRWLREVSGDDAYERYLSHHTQRHPDVRVPSRREFYAQELQRKWNGVSRCC
jgi:uncharacterized short protein YbdD (DUF466 family)